MELREPPPSGGRGSPEQVTRPTSRWAVWRWNRFAVVVLAIALAATAVLSWIAFTINSRNEKRLLNLQVQQTGTVLQVILPTIQTPLASAAEIAATSSGDAARFRSYMSSYVGGGTKPFVSASLWHIGRGVPRLVSVLGPKPRLTPGAAQPFFASTVKKPLLGVIGPLGGGAQRRLGYGYAAAGRAPSYAVYAESKLPPNRRVAVPKDSPFGDLRFALYLGNKSDPGKLLETNADLPLSGRSSMVVVPFGASSLTLVATAAEQLGGGLSETLWWIVAIAGSVLAVLAGFTTNRLIERRKAAERLTDDVQYLLSEQRGIAESLQRALLPQALPQIPGLQVGVRYVPGFVGVEIGGDWYDVIALDEHRFFFVIGDVSGRGVAAGSVMASLHFAIRGFVSEGHEPAKVLDTLTGLLDVSRDHHFATVLCGIADIDRREITIANAGHLPPLLIADGGSSFLSTNVGPPIGVRTTTPYQQVTAKVPANATVLTYTDGLIERRGETLDDGMNRLQQLAIDSSAPLEELLGTLVTKLGDHDSDDDTAILGMRWLS